MKPSVPIWRCDMRRNNGEDLMAMYRRAYDGVDPDVVFYCQNLFGNGEKTRYYLSSFLGTLPILSWVEEPRAFGLRATVRF